MQSFDVIIAGAGHGGAQAAISLRQHGFTGSIVLVGDESGWPYERPPLSKEYLLGDKGPERLLIRPPAFWEERQIALLDGCTVSGVDANARVIALADGTRLAYRALIWAAGGTPRRLSCAGADLPNAHVIRTRRDIDGILTTLPGVQRITVIGGGYIGLEAAAVLAKLGKTISVVEAADRVLARVAAEPLSRIFEAVHRSHGVEIRTGVQASAIEERNGAAAAVILSDGNSIETDMVIVGIGIVPNVQALAAAGADVCDGVIVDARCRTSLPDIYAIGDCARHPSAFSNSALVRLESVQNATDQANVVAGNLCGKELTYDAVPWFWSTQYDLKLQTVGLSSGYDQTVVRGDPDSGSFSLIYLHAGRVIALDCVNAVKDYVQGRKLVVEGATIDPRRLADTSVALKDMIGG